MVTRLDQAILHTITYADIFNYPLTLPELERYLIGIAASPVEISEGIHGLQRNGTIREIEGFFTLIGRENLVALRRERKIRSARLWPLAIRFGQCLARVPFVRMVAVTGALAVDNVTAEADIDFLLVTEPGRLWISRLMAIGVVRWAALFGVRLCPNYIISENVLTFEQQNIYTAHDLAQMVPITGLDTYRRIREVNQWIYRFLPNSHGWPQSLSPQSARPSNQQDKTYLVQRWIEVILRFPWANKLETWEMQRKIRKFKRQAPNAGGLPQEVSFCADWCKGHFDRHLERSLAAFEQRLERLEGEPSLLPADSF